MTREPAAEIKIDLGRMMKTLAQTRRLEQRLRTLVTSWRLRAEPFAEHHCDAVAAAYRLLASEVEAELRAWDSETLPIPVAAAESGYSAEHLRRLTRDGRLLSERGQGAKSHVRIRRESLPAKTERAARRSAEPRSVYNPDEDARDIAKRLGGSHA